MEMIEKCFFADEEKPEQKPEEKPEEKKESQ